MAVVGGPVLGPIVGGAIVQSYLGWRWTEYVSNTTHHLPTSQLLTNPKKSPDNRHHANVLPNNGPPYPR
jgi:hypothetical protein